jgi:hypothetical protein
MVSYQKLGIQISLVRKGGKRMKRKRILFWILLVMLLWPLTEAAFSAEKEKEFEKIKKMGLRELTPAATDALGKKYPGENWEKYKFPKYVYIHNAVLAGYKIAVKEPQLLAKFPCYCLCDVMGHKNLSYCFLEKGVPDKFDDHASTCNICINQAMMAFLWNELGASEEEMLKAFKEIYQK